MVRGTPVACSRASAIPEVAGDAALYFDPRDTSCIVRRLDQLLSDSQLRERLRTAGYERAREFSWNETAVRTLEGYTRALATARS
jgi:glycosyltransferase involved in cell wall biosynthesis